MGPAGYTSLFCITLCIYFVVYCGHRQQDQTSMLLQERGQENRGSEEDGCTIASVLISKRDGQRQMSHNDGGISR